MSDLKFFTILIFVLTICLSVCNAATLPDNGNKTSESTAVMAKTSPAIVVDVFEDVQWFFTRLGIFCDLVEQMLPPEQKSIGQTQLSVGLTLQGGFRHFLLGVREISKSIIAVLSNKEIQEYKQLSRATDYAQEMVKTTGDFFRNFRRLIGQLFETYNFYVPEVMLTKCVGRYMHVAYSHRPMYEYPILFINDIIEAFQTVKLKIDDVTSSTDRKLGTPSEITFDKNVEQNEILDDEMYLFHNTPISPSPELAGDGDTTLDNKTAAVEDESSGTKETSLAETISWKKCFKIYATETIFRKLEFYFLELRA